jgi:hypothetical protein
MKTSIRSMGLLVCLATAVQAQNAVPLPSFTVYGVVKSWNGRAYSSNDNATVIARINGVEMDRCNAVSGIYPDLNYRLHIPMASAPIPGRGEIGDPLAFDVYYDGQMHAVFGGDGSPVVGEPGGALECHLVVGSDSAGDGLPDEYKALLLPYYIEAGMGSSIADISANDDFDGDGYSNFQEFLAGTSPVDASDFLKIDEFRKAADGLMALTFLSAPGRTYVVPRTDNLATGSWSAAELALSTNELPARPFFSSPRDAYVTLYLLPTTNTTYRLDVQ